MNHHTRHDTQLLAPKNCIILLGASNLTLSLRLVTHLMQQQFGGPSEILVAVGHGRAYGSANQVLLRGLPATDADAEACARLEHLLDVLRRDMLAVTEIGREIALGVCKWHEKADETAGYMNLMLN